MAFHNNLGRTGEDLAARWLAEQGYRILQRNWRHGRYEVDVIAIREAVLHFIEIKTRRTRSFGQPEESVNAKKIRHLMNAAASYIYQARTKTKEQLFWKRIQYDVLSLSIRKGMEDEYFLIEDVFA